MELEDCCKVDIHVKSPLSSSSFGTVRLGITPGVLIPTYSSYFLTQFGLFLFLRVKYKYSSSYVRTFIEKELPN